MKIPCLGTLIALFCLSACSSDSAPEPVEENKNEEVLTSEETDMSSPEISINGLDSTIEIKTSFQVVVVDNSEVETKIIINEEEVFTSADKQFAYELNPYTIDVGAVTLKIVSEDSYGNITEKEENLEIKHLLMDFDLGINEMINVEKAWVFFNDSVGNLIATQLLQNGNNKIYTDSLIEDEKVYYTLVKFWTYNSNYAHSLLNSTYKVFPGEKRNEFNFIQPNRDQEFELEITRDELVNPWSKFTVLGSNYRNITSFGVSTSDPTYIERYIIEYSFPETVYVRTANTNAGDTFDGKKENYLYYKLNPTPQESKINILEADFKSMDDFTVQEIPPHDTSNFSFSRYGYENEADMNDNIYHLIYSLHESFDFILSDYLDLPQLEGLSYYRNNVRFEKDGVRVNVQQFGNSVDLSIPQWQLTNFGISDGRYFIEADNVDVDYYLLSLSKASDTTDPRKDINWVYRTFGNAAQDKTTPILSLPEEITTSLGDSFYTSADMSMDYVTAVDYQMVNSLSEATDYRALRKLALKTNEKDFKSIRFTNSGSSTGKSDISNQLQSSEEEIRF